MQFSAKSSRETSMPVRTGESLYSHRRGRARGQLECPVGLMDVLEIVRMQAWQDKETPPISLSPGLSLSAGRQTCWAAAGSFQN